MRTIVVFVCESGGGVADRSMASDGTPRIVHQFHFVRSIVLLSTAFQEDFGSKERDEQLAKGSLSAPKKKLGAKRDLVLFEAVIPM